MSSVGAVVVAIGPGSFSGIRVGLAEGKGIAMGLGVPLVGISTLDVFAFQAARCGGDVWAVLPAGREQVYTAHYSGEPERWQRIEPYRLLPAEEFTSAVADGALITGENIEPLAAALLRAGVTIRLPQPPERLRRAAYLAELGRRYLDAGGEDQLNYLEPLYLRLSSAEEKRARDSEV